MDIEKESVEEKGPENTVINVKPDDCFMAITFQWNPPNKNEEEK